MPLKVALLHLVYHYCPAPTVYGAGHTFMFIAKKKGVVILPFAYNF